MTFSVFDKNSMRKILLFVAFLPAVSCGVEYDAETRLVSETRLIDKVGNPIEGQPVEIWVTDNGFSDKIANTVTDTNGKSLLIFPAPNDIQNSRIEIRFPQHGTFAEKSFREIMRADFTDYKYTLNDVVLYPMEELTNLFVETNNSSGSTLKAFYLEDDSASESVYVNPPVENVGPQTYFRVLQNSTANLFYTVRSQAGVESTLSVSIPIGTQNVTYTLNY